MNKSLKFLLIVIMALFLVVGCTKDEGGIIKDTIKDEDAHLPEIYLEDYNDIFGDAKGCSVFYSIGENKYIVYNQELTIRRHSPCSTFKIVTTIMGLDSKVITSEDSKFGYNGKKYPVEVWNKDLTLEEAFKSSAIWYFNKIVNSLDKSYVKEVLDKLSYGNKDISEWKGSKINSMDDLNGFWLESSLLVSPKEQADMLKELFGGNTDFKKEHLDILKSVMYLEDIGDIKLYGKTGSGTNDKGEVYNAWFVGFLEKDDNVITFAVHLDESDINISSELAKSLTKSIIEREFNS